MDYHVARNSQKLGVFSEEEVRNRLQTGELLASDLVWREGMAAWQPAAEVFASSIPNPPAAPATPPAGLPPPPAPVTPGGAPPPKPDNYLIWAILATVLCCLPFGIVSIIFASQVDTKYSAGDYAGAQESAGKAKVWFWVAAIVGGLPLVGAAIFFGGTMLLGIFGGLASGMHS